LIYLSSAADTKQDTHGPEPAAQAVILWAAEKNQRQGGICLVVSEKRKTAEGSWLPVIGSSCFFRTFLPAAQMFSRVCFYMRPAA